MTEMPLIILIKSNIMIPSTFPIPLMIQLTPLVGVSLTHLRMRLL